MPASSAPNTQTTEWPVTGVPGHWETSWSPAFGAQPEYSTPDTFSSTQSPYNISPGFSSLAHHQPGQITQSIAKSPLISHDNTPSSISATPQAETQSQSQNLTSPILRPVTQSRSSTSPSSSSSSNSASKSPNSPSSSHTSSNIPASKIQKRTLNTLAARRYRQKRVDQMSSLEMSLKETENERDELKLKVARLEAEVGILRGLVKGA